VDDEPLLHKVIERVFARENVQVICRSDALQAIEVLQQESFDLLITDFSMPEMDGLELLAHVRQEYPHLKVIMITAHASVQHAVSAMKNGVIDYIPKPFSTAELVERVQKHLSTQQQEAVKKTPPAPKGRPKPGVEFIGEHTSILGLKGLLPRLAKSRAPVFVSGESGTGKEIMARLIHQTSDRHEGPYIAINCANLPKELVESHLFGHCKGAFTGAIADMVGAFERADGGTLFLDEVTEIDFGVQAKLLRVLQEQEFQKVGDGDVKKVNVRVIAASNRNLQEAIQQGTFREDLYHRIAVFPLYVPTLRDRSSDIPLLAEYFVEKYCKLYDLPAKTLAPHLMRRFESFAWPGNVRQLENLVHRGVVLAADRDVVKIEDVMNEFFSDGRPQEPDNLKALGGGDIMTIEEMERHLILKVLNKTDNNQRIAAEKLGISSRTIRLKLSKYREEGLFV
jgi:DNA-binding NtrC family response regulator